MLLNFIERHMRSILYGNAAIDFYLGLFGSRQVSKFFIKGSRSTAMTHSLQYQILMHGIARAAAAADGSLMSTRMAASSYLLEALYFSSLWGRGLANSQKIIAPIFGSFIAAMLLLRRNSGLGCPKKNAQLGSIKTEKTEKTEAHPLDPLSMKELAEAVSILKHEKKLGELVRFVSINLQEPPKLKVQEYERAGVCCDREAFVVLLDNGDGNGGTNNQAIESVVSITTKSVVSYEAVDGQPSMTLDEMNEIEDLIKANPSFEVAMGKRGYTDMSCVCVDPWSAGSYSTDLECDKGVRLCRALCWVRSGGDQSDNLYAHPVDGLVVMVDMSATPMVVLRVEDHYTAPIPSQSANYTAAHVRSSGGFRQPPKPLEILQPQGTSFRVLGAATGADAVIGHEVRWQKWRMRLGFTSREVLSIVRDYLT
jgi:Cu2+-containing amine oxidase